MTLGFLVQVVIALAIVGVVLYMIKKYIPMDPPVMTVITVVVVLVLCIWLLQVFGVIGAFRSWRGP